MKKKLALVMAMGMVLSGCGEDTTTYIEVPVEVPVEPEKPTGQEWVLDSILDSETTIPSPIPNKTYLGQTTTTIYKYTDLELAAHVTTTVDGYMVDTKKDVETTIAELGELQKIRKYYVGTQSDYGYFQNQVNTRDGEEDYTLVASSNSGLNGTTTIVSMEVLAGYAEATLFKQSSPVATEFVSCSGDMASAVVCDSGATITPEQLQQFKNNEQLPDRDNASRFWELVKPV